ncbi:hypothetical protein GF412_02795 [Candidatus Micrarchaeota archaeon]|nr:hypothetical protein [Candidatus Micrarchaeota archaeon]MBD3417886.1 hypothetical protein [Candidatus Micrarchaeota archaeon]
MAPKEPNAPYIKQISIYLQQEEYTKALGLAEEFAEKFPDSMAAHFLAAKSAFWLNDFKTAKKEAQTAFNLSEGEEELAVSGILLACSHYQLKEYKKGLEILALLKSRMDGKEEIMKLKFVFALALNDEPAARRHLEDLYSINRKEASAIMLKFLKKGRE